MMNLPQNWAVSPLAEILPLQYGKALPEKSRISDGPYPVYGSSGQVGSHDAYLTEGPTIVVGRKGSAGAVYHVTLPCWPIDTAYYTVSSDLLCLKFFFYYLSFLRLGQLDQSTAIPSLSRDIYNQLQVFIPPFNEQQRIVEKIEELFSRIDAGEAALKKAQALLKQYRQSLLKAAVTGELTREWREKNKDKIEPADKFLTQLLKERRAKREATQLAKTKVQGKISDDISKESYQEPNSPDGTDLPKLPEGWKWTNLNQLKTFSLYGPRFSSDDYSTSGPLVLRTSDISEAGKVNLNTAPHLPLTPEEFAKYKAERGDLLITRTGSLGTLAVFDDIVEAIPGAYLIQYRLAAPLETSWYVFYFLKSPVGQKQLIGGGAGVGRPNLNAPTIEAIPIPLPPFAEQTHILAEVESYSSVIDQLEITIDAELKRSEHLRQSVLKSAFSGQVVTQDPADEPASVLLERIKAERQKTNPSTTSRTPKAQKRKKAA
jgi:type I restriction enzyme S subunit